MSKLTPEYSRILRQLIKEWAVVDHSTSLEIFDGRHLYSLLGDNMYVYSRYKVYMIDIYGVSVESRYSRMSKRPDMNKVNEYICNLQEYLESGQLYVYNGKEGRHIDSWRRLDIKLDD